MIYNKIYTQFKDYKVSKQVFLPYLKNLLQINDDEVALEVLRGAGFWFLQNQDSLEIETLYKGIESSVFCFVDIETTGSKPMESNIIEIGAIKYRNGEIIDEFQTLVYNSFVPPSIAGLTGIDTQMIKNAPSEKQSLYNFRNFLGDSVFVAHNVNFDYGFISTRLRVYGSIELLNPRICTVELARKTILSLRYSLAYLNEFLGINIPDNHRAYFDALTCLKVFEIACLALPKDAKTIQDLIEFSRGKKA